MTQTLRPHQSATQQLCVEILSGSDIKTIIEDVTPGGGKSKLPVILASMLIPTWAERILWVVPRNSLKYQGEEEFIDPRFPTDRRMRAADGNESNPDRGTDGYITTYQAIGMSPEVHLEYMRKHRTILFLDEPHHIAEDSSWDEALAPMVSAACLVVYASGTLSRGDGQKIAFLDYVGQHVNLRDREHVRVIRYTRSQAIRDGAILPVYGKTIDGAAEWRSAEGIHRKIDSLYKAGTDRSAALFTALRTEYAYELLDECIRNWEDTRPSYPDAKLLVVAPDIEFAKQYHQHVAGRYLAEIATSDDTPGAKRVIAAFKRGVFNVLVCVGMCYEGLSVPTITHIACLTGIRSVPWLEQCFARTNRVAPGKKCGVIYGPADRMFIDAMRMIEAEQRPGLKDEDNRRVKSDNPVELVESIAAPGIEPLWSTAHGITAPLPQGPRPIAQSEMEKALIGNIRAIRTAVLATKRQGNLQTSERLFNLRIRTVSDKSLDEMTVDELTAVWMMLRKEYS